MEKLILLCEEMEIPFYLNKSFSEITTFKTGGKIRLFVQVYNTASLERLMKYIWEKQVKYKFLGNGSNVLVCDEDFDGVVIDLKGEFSEVLIKNNIIKVGSKFKISRLAWLASGSDLEGMEFAVSIPATVGGAVYGNAGAHGTEIKDILKTAKVLSKSGVKLLTAQQLNYSYRNSLLKQRDEKDIIVLGATFELKKASDTKATVAKMKNYVEKRNENQPVNEACAGSIFKNPENGSAWKVISDAGLRGYEIGGAKVSEKHANFIVNTGTATSKDIKDLIEHIKNTVYNKLGIRLVEEIEYFNFD